MNTKEIDSFSSTHDHNKVLAEENKEQMENETSMNNDLHRLSLTQDPNKGDKNSEVDDQDDHDLLSRITVRSYKESDADDFMFWGRDPELGRFKNWVSPESREDARMMIMVTRDFHPWYRTICLDDKSIGEVSVTPTKGSCRAQISYALGKAYRGKGIVTHVVKSVSRSVLGDTALSMIDLQRLEAFVDVENLASQRVLEKAGFLREGVLRKYCLNNGITRDTIVYSLLSTDFLSLYS